METFNPASSNFYDLPTLKREESEPNLRTSCVQVLKKFDYTALRNTLKHNSGKIGAGTETNEIMKKK